MDVPQKQLNQKDPQDVRSTRSESLAGSPGLGLKIRACVEQFIRTAVNFYYFVHRVIQFRYMIRNMVGRDLRSRYVGSFLGVFWPVIHMLTQILLYYFVFSVVLKVKLGEEYSYIGFAVWLVAGVLPWMFFAEVMSRSPGAVVEQSNLITKTVFPSEIIAIVHVAASLINHLIGIVVYLAVLLLTGHALSIYVFMLLPLLLMTAIFALGLAWAISALNVFLRDIGQIINVIVNIWFFMTPIIYPKHLIPERLQGAYHFNPLLHIVEGYRTLLLGREQIDWRSLLYILVSCTITLILGGLIFKKLKPDFADVL